MFTGIVESKGLLRNRRMEGDNLILTLQSDLAFELKVDQSLAHNGICLTVTKIEGASYTVCAVPETIHKTTIASWKEGDLINLERGMLLSARLDGHLVQGHVDTTAVCIERIDGEGHWKFRFKVNESFRSLFIEKGSVTINGISLTCFQVDHNSFEVAIIPYTFEHTNIYEVHVGDLVNIEFDVIGKYILRSRV